MKVGQVSSSGGARSTRRTEKSDRKGEEAFSAHLRCLVESGEPAPTETTAAIGGIDALLMVQGSTDNDSQARRRMVQRGEDVLECLEDIRKGLLLGTIPKERLTGLAQMMRLHREQGVDAALAAILDEIELRAEVELAKLTRR
ncbi:MAG: fliX [Rhodospirillaceae bacterium]|nr:MAG: fliX [Rhodospirillaceae bacterium]